MSDFNAGSISGTVELDSRPFLDELRVIQAEAEKFEAKRWTARISLSSEGVLGELAKIKAELEAIDSFTIKANVKGGAFSPMEARTPESVTTKIDADPKPAEAKIGLVKSMLMALAARVTRPKIDADTSGLTKNVGEANTHLERLNKLLDAGGVGGAMTNPALTAGKFTAIGGGILSLAAAAGSAATALSAFAVAGATAMVGVMASVKLATSVIGEDFKNLQSEAAKGVKSAQAANQALKGMEAAWKSLVKTTEGGMFDMMTKAFDGAASVLPKLVPLVNSLAHGLSSVIDQLVAVTKLPLFSGFITTLSGFMDKFLVGLGGVLSGLLKTFMEVFTLAQPLLDMLGKGIKFLVDELESFTFGGGMEQFFAYAVQVIPSVISLVGDLLGAVGKLGSGLAPLAAPAISFLDALVKMVGSINLKPLADAFAAVLGALQPLLPFLGQLVNTLLPPIGKLITEIANGPLKSLVDALATKLGPVLPKIGDALSALAGPLAAFIGSIANFANSTGVGLVAGIIGSIADGVAKLAKPLSDIGVGLESFVDALIDGLAPSLPGINDLLGKLFDGLDKILTPIAGLVNGALGAFVKDVMPKLADGLSTVVGKLGGFADAVGRLFDSFTKNKGAVDGFSSGFGKILDVFGKLLGMAWDNFIRQVSGVLDFFTQLADKLSTSKEFKDVVEKLGTAFGKLGDAIGSLLPHQDALNANLKDGKAKSADFSGAIGAVVKVIVGFVDSVATVVDALAKVITFLRDFPKNFSAFWKGLADGFHKWADDLKKGWGDFWKGVGDGIVKFGAGVKKSWDAFWKGIGDALSKFGTDISKAWTGLWKGIGDWFGEWWPLLVKMFAPGLFTILKLWAQFGPGVQKVFDDVVKGATDFAKSVWDTIKGAWDSIFGSTKSFASDIVSTIGKGFDDVFSSAKKFADDILSQIKGAWDAIMSTAGVFVTDFLNKVKEAWDEAVSSVAQFASDIKDAVGKALTDAAKAVTDTLSDWGRVGQSIVDGIVGGITGAAHTLYASLEGLAKNALASAKAALVINSPSHLFRDEVGGGMVEGWADGVTVHGHRVITSVKSLAGRLVGAARSAMSGLGGDLGDLSMTGNLKLAGVDMANQLTAAQLAELRRHNDLLTDLLKKVGSPDDTAKAVGAGMLAVARVKAQTERAR